MERDFDYVAFRVSIFMRTANTVFWNAHDWTALYEQIASWEQLNQCVYGNCPDSDNLPSQWMN